MSVAMQLVCCIATLDHISVYVRVEDNTLDTD